MSTSSTPRGGARPPWGGPAPAESRIHRRIPWALALALLLLAIFQLGAAPLFDVDEGAFSEATREMLQSGDWGHTTLNGEDRFDKPILVYWLQAASVGLLGLNEFALRLPSALCAWGWALALFVFARPRLGDRVAVSAALMLATSLGVLAIGRAATADALLNFLLVLTVCDAWRWLETEQKAPLRRAFAWMGLGLLAKGPVAVLVPVAAGGVWLITAWDWRLALRRIGQAVGDVPAWLLLIGIAAPWYAYALNRHGQAFIDGFFVRHNLARYSSAMEQHGGGVGYYLAVLPLLLLPWAPLLAAVVWRAKAHWRDPLGRFLLGWGGFVLVFFSLSGTKLPHYVLYGATPFVLLMAIELERCGQAMRWALAVSALILLALFVVPAWLLPWLLPLVPKPEYRALLSHAPAALGLMIAGTVAAGVVIGLAAAPARLREGLAPSATPLLSSCVVALVLLGFGLPWWGTLLQGPVREAGLHARQRPEVAVQWKLHRPSFAVYREQPTPRRAPAPGELALVNVEHLKKLPANDANAYDIEFEERGIALIRWRGAR
ncbi:MAG TPA: glycosyltransferase family 39 protein [Ideonella sp.]|uniref:ArnT family glycosyltransferase n=1 Tax=Ideonella sp. TaxID=1929293 RepID=UPI002E2FE0C7|nr:glycosyltransferase family 39 protein [Ideonella sp.]HEX5682724.1 glycosyltransferase family 39 protein [Ideonella sp.]